MSALTEGQFRLGRFTWGRGTAAPIISMDLSSMSLTQAAIERVGGHGEISPRSRLRSATWTWTIGLGATVTGAPGPGGIYPLSRALHAAWRPDEMWDVDRPVPLYLCAGGRELMVWGTPGTITLPQPDIASKHGYQQVTASFKVLDPLMYSAAETSVELALWQPIPSGGLRFPATPPFTFDGVPGQSRVGFVTIDGTARAPYRLEIIGPVSSPKCWTDGWGVSFPSLSIGEGQTVVIDTRLGTCQWRTGEDATGHLSHDSRLRGTLPVGRHEVRVDGIDATGRSRFRLSWHTADYSL